jgi:hypothetical protein
MTWGLAAAHVPSLPTDRQGQDPQHSQHDSQKLALGHWILRQEENVLLV